MAAVKQVSIEDEYKKNNGITPEDIANLRRWVHTQPHLPAEHITDLDLMLAYNCSERSAEVAKQLLDLHFTLKTLFTGFFQHRVVDDRIDRAVSSVLVTPLPTRTAEGYAVLFACFMEKDARNFNLVDVVRSVIMILELWQCEEGCWPGFVIMFDLQNMTLGHVTKFDLHNVSHYMYYLQNGLLANLRGVHYLNAPSFMDRFMTVVRPFMRNTLLEVVHAHQAGGDTVHRHYPGGGRCRGRRGEEQILSKLHASQSFFDEESKKRVVEANRPGKPKTISDIFGGVEGSFKKLEFD